MKFKKIVPPILIALCSCLGSISHAQMIATRALEAHFDSNDGGMALYDKRSDTWYHSVAGKTTYSVESVSHGKQSISATLQGSHNDTYTVEWTFTDTATLSCTVSAQASQPLDTGELSYPYPMTLSADNSYIVLSDSGGFMFKADGSNIPPQRLKKPVYGMYHHYDVMMAMFGITDLKNGLVVVYETPADASIRLQKFDHIEAGEGFAPSVLWQPEFGRFGPTRSVKIHVSDKGGYVPLAKFYRQHCIEQGRFKSLRDKAKERESVQRLVGAPHTWIMSAKHTRSMGLLDELAESGIKKLVLKTDTYANYPDYRIKGKDVEIDQDAHYAFMDRAHDYGYLVGKYITYSSIRPFKPEDEWFVLNWNFLQLRDDNFLPYSGIVDKNNKRMLGWEQRGVRVCDRFGMEEIIPEHKEFYRDYFMRHKAFFYDVEGAIKPLECYDPDHAMSRTECMEWREIRAQYFKQFNPDWVIGTETGHDYLLPHYDWIEGPPTNVIYTDKKLAREPNKSKFFMGEWRRNKDREPPILYKTCYADEGTLKYVVNPKMRIPLYELVHGDQVVSTCRWEYPHNKHLDIWKTKDLYAMLWGTAPTYNITQKLWNQQKDEILSSIDQVCSWLEQIGYDEIVNFEYLTDDLMVQRSTFSSGKSITVNFGEESVKIADQEIGAMCYAIQ